MTIKEGQNQTETKCCALCKYWNYDGIQKYCFFEREKLKRKERFDTCENFKDARKFYELKRK